MALTLKTILFLLPGENRVEEFLVFRTLRIVVFVVFGVVVQGVRVALRRGERTLGTVRWGRRRGRLRTSRRGQQHRVGSGVQVRGIGTAGVVTVLIHRLGIVGQGPVVTHLGLVVLDHLLQRSDVLHGQSQCFDFAELLRGPPSLGRTLRRQSLGDTRWNVRSQRGEPVVYLLHPVPLPGVPPGHGGRLLRRAPVRHELDLPLAPQVVVVGDEDGTPLWCRRQGPLAGYHGLLGRLGDDDTVTLRRGVLDHVVHFVLMSQGHGESHVSGHSGVVRVWMRAQDGDAARKLRMRTAE